MRTAAGYCFVSQIPWWISKPSNNWMFWIKYLLSSAWTCGILFQVKKENNLEKVLTSKLKVSEMKSYNSAELNSWLKRS